jgi:protease-4
LSIALNIYLLIFSGMTSAATGGGRAERISDGNSREQVAVYPIHGVIDDELARLIDKQLTAAEKDSSIKAVVLHIDTPGGGVTSSDEIYARILRFKEKKNVPVVATMGALGTSGGYYIACACDHVFAEATTWTGNIGVLQEGFNVSELCQKWGIKETTIVPAGAPYKNAGSMFQPERAEDIKYMQEMVEQAFARFKYVVTTGRKGKLTQSVEAIANGKVYDGPQAKKLGLVDDIGYAPDAYDKAAQLAGLKDKQVVYYEQPTGLLKLLGANSNQTQPGASAPSGTNLPFDINSIRELMTPKLMYLWRGR